MEISNLVFALCIALAVHRSDAATPVLTVSATTVVIAENTAAGTAVVSGMTADQLATWTVAGDDASLFVTDPTAATTAVADTVALKVATGATLDYETKRELSVTITATNAGGEAGTHALTIFLSNVLETVTFESSKAVVLAAGATSSTTVATMAARDYTSGTTITYAIATGDTNTFEISTAGVISIKSGVTLSTSGVQYFLIITAADGTSTGSNTASTSVGICIGTCPAACGLSGGIMLTGALSTLILAVIFQLA